MAAPVHIIQSTARANAAVTNAIRSGQPADVVADLKRDRVVAIVANRARKALDAEGVYLDDARVAALAELLTGRGGESK